MSPNRQAQKHRVVELFGRHTLSEAGWQVVLEDQICPFSAKRCFKTRKSDSETAIGTCSVRVADDTPLIICPNRLLERRQVFEDCRHLLTRHTPGNELHVIPEVSIPGGSVDYFLVSCRNDLPVDFVGIEFQTLDTTGTVWPSRQSFLRSIGLDGPVNPKDANKTYGINWKMTAKTILMQMHHKIETFEVMDRKLVLAVQTPLMDYMKREFDFGHLTSPAQEGDSLHIHSYDAVEAAADLRLALHDCVSTNSSGLARALNLGAAAEVDENSIMRAVKGKMSTQTRWSPA